MSKSESEADFSEDVKGVRPRFPLQFIILPVMLPRYIKSSVEWLTLRVSIHCGPPMLDV